MSRQAASPSAFAAFSVSPLERVESEEGIGARRQRDFRDSDLWDQVPSDDIAERLVLAHSVHINRDAFRSSEQRRGGISAVVDIRLQGILLVLVDVHAAERAVEEVSEIERATLLDIARRGCLDRGGYLIEREIRSGERGGADYIDPGSLRGQRHSHTEEDGGSGLDVDYERPCGESAPGCLDPVTPVGQALNDVHSLGIGLLPTRNTFIRTGRSRRIFSK